MSVQAVSPRTVIAALFSSDGVASLADIYDVGLRLRIGEQRMRLAIRRQIAAGECEQFGRGRAGVLKRTTQRLNRDANDYSFIRLAYAQDEGLVGWAGKWHLLSLSIPESQRATRDAVRATVTRLGGALLHPGVYISAHDWNSVLVSETHELNVLDQATVAVVADLRVGAAVEPKDIAALLWPLDELRQGYEDLAALSLQATESLAENARGAEQTNNGRIDTVEVLAIALELATSFGAAHASDPLLPQELLPDDWPGERARSAFRAAWSEVHSGTGVELFPYLAEYRV